MNEILFKSIALVGGVALGIVFFGGLWFTLRKAMVSNQPALWFFGSLITRVGIVMLGFYAVMQRANWLDGLICLLGFVAARFMILRLTKAYELRISNSKKEVLHEA